MGNNNAVLVCKRVEDMGEPTVASRLGKCGLCANPIWVAASSPPVGRYLCMQCATEEIEPGDAVGRVTEAQLRDLEAYFNRRRS